ncbi:MULTISPECIES: cyclopropane-fatty-acyl-phospholipid synthase family protein [unclassified Streptomyces]|uniref:SAM-dependent methyltransferase n=1 Tax=unclassified Streptomyces TaxID=2593676 RepID=UPI000DB92D19|nr:MULTISPECIES: cyclopropane-fatty-acyl-phospholipid synthase family protein [unclassified Streptomyces]MYT75333.1 methyltransferase domain-containing protein [Streptomyces sp. SID8367]RAJ86735.1 cyclopropane-fatty-acyl-phospholipid synthase [Streptomyces sp. PsTaAH-137]
MRTDESPSTTAFRGTARPASGVDPVRWPDVAATPRVSRARTAVAAAVVRHALERLPLRVRFADGTELGRGGPLLEVRQPRAFHARIGRDGLIGFGESYMAREWDAPDLVAVLTVLAAHAADLVPAPLQRLRGLWALRRPAAQRNSPDGSRENISHHYDLSNDLFALFLDETLSYSSAAFRALPAEWNLLADAQRRKIDRLLDLAEVGDGTRVLEIGTGWGELALRAAARGAHVTSLTLSHEQRDLARERIAAAGFADRVTVELCDYREARGTYDAVVSVEMIEAVGAEFWPVYFRTLDARLAPGGRVALQAITMPHERMLASGSTYTWIQKYIFPGGLLPSVEAVAEVVRDHTALSVTRRDGYGAHYAETLRLWRERFAARADEVDALGFDETFRRMWTFYLAYSEAGFRSGYLDVQQYLFTKEASAR